MFRILLLIFVLDSFVFGGCYEDCVGNVAPLLIQTNLAINTAYTGLDGVMTAAETSYGLYLAGLTYQNSILEDILKVRRHNSIKMKEINFLLSKLIHQKDVQIDINLQKDILKFQQSLINAKDIK